MRQSYENGERDDKHDFKENLTLYKGGRASHGDQIYQVQLLTTSVRVYARPLALMLL